MTAQESSALWLSVELDSAKARLVGYPDKSLSRQPLSVELGCSKSNSMSMVQRNSQAENGSGGRDEEIKARTLSLIRTIVRGPSVHDASQQIHRPLCRTLLACDKFAGRVADALCFVVVLQ